MHFLSSKLEQLYSHPSETSLARKNGRVSKILSGSFLNRIEILRDAIDEIKKEINKRKKLSKALKKKIEAEIFNFDKRNKKGANQKFPQLNLTTTLLKTCLSKQLPIAQACKGFLLEIF